MKIIRYLVTLFALIAALGVRRWRRRSRSHDGTTARVPRAPRRGIVTGDIALVMSRELRERVRSRFYLVGTVVILLVVAAAIIIPVVKHSSAPHVRIGVVDTLSPGARATISSAALTSGASVSFVTESSVAQSAAAMAAGKIDFAIVSGTEIIVNTLYSPSDLSTTAIAVRTVATRLGDQRALSAAHLSAQQAAALASAGPLSIVALHHGTTKGVNATSLIGVILIFIMLSQYNTWILVGVMEEKSSRVIEVLLSTVRPIRLLTGKVLGIGLAALMQASLIVAFALVLSKIVGSTVLHGTGPLEIASTLVWLVLGYSLYSWVYAAAGSMAERQDQVQSLALPLSLPLIVGYVVALTGASAATPSLLVKIFAYIPLTAPFAMTVLVGFGAVAWWQFAASVLITLASTFAVARLATRIYRRAILRTGSRVRFKDFRTSK
ncbi:MAG: ABC transporter permease [Acidimicrobiaceae bacterium]|nr:ABC transporter permease [Acidimicrobiaceae bacterium]